MNSPKREWAAYYREVAEYHAKAIEWYKARNALYGTTNARMKSMNRHHQWQKENVEKAADRAQFALENEAPQTEDVFASSVGDGTGQGTEGVTRTVEQSARGKTDWFADGSTVVTLFATADFSTMLHEMSHVFLEQEFKLAQGPNASERLKADVETIKAWLAANGHPVVDGIIPVGAHELWARTGERYFREGKAPSAELRGAFQQFKTWLRDVYKSIQALTAYGPAMRLRTMPSRRWRKPTSG